MRQSLPLPDLAGRSHWYRGGISRRAERLFNRYSIVLVIIIGLGWSWSLATARSLVEHPGGARTEVLCRVTGGIGAALTRHGAPTAAYVTDALLDALVVPLRGRSGRLLAAIGPEGAPILRDTLPTGAVITYTGSGASETGEGLRAPGRAGVWELAIRIGNTLKPITDMRVITLRPASDTRRGRIGLYYIGNWPAGGAGPNYAPPSGFIEVTPENQGTQVSEHFQLRDFLPKDQRNVWPKYLVLDTKLVDKLELVLEELREQGVNPRGVTVMSGFRTPQYNAGVGDTRGRASLSRHMYGDAADIYIDNSGNGSMDDINRDGRVDVRDAEFIRQAAERVERRHPELVGGIGVYRANPSHGPFTHIDTRGYRARW
jgi:hypothetical protein